MRISLRLCMTMLALHLGLAAQTPDKSYFQQMYQTTRQARQTELKSKIARSLAKPPAVARSIADYDATYYDLNFVFSTAPNNLAGTVTGVFRSNVDGLQEV